MYLLRRCDITTRCLPGEREMCGRSTANKKLITKSSEAKKPHGSMILFFCSLRGLSVIGSSPSPSSAPSPPNSMPIPFYLLIMWVLVPANPECKLLCVNKISAAAIRTLWLSLPYISLLSPLFRSFALSSHLPVARKITLA